MALGKCKECGAQVSSNAKACPSCGAKVKKKAGLLAWLFVIVIVLPIAWQYGSGLNETHGGAGTSTAATTPAPTWERIESADPMTDALTVVYRNTSKNAAMFERPYAKPGGSKLTINIRKRGANLDAYLAIEKGQMLCSSIECDFNLRIGTSEVQRWQGSQSSTRDSDIMFIANPREFEAAVRRGEPVRIGIKFFRQGEHVFEFDTAGYPAE